MGQQPGRDYDSFVVRLWHQAESNELLRAEIEHVQSGAVDTRLSASWEWLRDRLRAFVSRSNSNGGNAS